jgi:hypothetical protein
VIFISYSWADAIFVRTIVTALNKQGYQVWIDYQNLNLDKPLAPQLAAAIFAADIFLFVDSPHAYSSRWVQFELLLAQLLHKSIQIIHVPIKAISPLEPSRFGGNE